MQSRDEAGVIELSDTESGEVVQRFSTPGGDVRAALETWRNSLVNLTGTNRLINFKRSRTSMVEITGPSAAAVLEGLRQGRTWKFSGAGTFPSRPDGPSALAT